MRHKKFGKKLNRDIKERKALFRSLINSLILHGRIKTTQAKAKAVTSLIEKLVTKAKDGSWAQVNQLKSFLNRSETVKKLTDEIAPRFQNKVGGYIRMIRLGRRKSDSAQEVLVEWTIPEEKKVQKKEKKGDKGKDNKKDKKEVKQQEKEEKEKEKKNDRKKRK